MNQTESVLKLKANSNLQFLTDVEKFFPTHDINTVASHNRLIDALKVLEDLFNMLSELQWYEIVNHVHLCKCSIYIGS